jgi:enoyl-CoA hydratase
VLWVTFNRPKAHNAMTFAMYEALFERCEDADTEDDVGARTARRWGKGVRGRHGHQPVRSPATTASSTRLRSTASSAAWPCPSRRLRSWTATRWAADSRSAACDLRVCTPEATFGLLIARTVGNCLSMENYARLAALLGAALLKELIFTARSIDADEALRVGLATEVVEGGEAEAHVQALCERLASHAPVTLRVTKEALRRLRAAGMPAGDDLVREAYGSEDFRRTVEAFLAKRR